MKRYKHLIDDWIILIVVLYYISGLPDLMAWIEKRLFTKVFSWVLGLVGLGILVTMVIHFFKIV